jgi:hypothetical protein
MVPIDLHGHARNPIIELKIAIRRKKGLMWSNDHDQYELDTIDPNI